MNSTYPNSVKELPEVFFAILRPITTYIPGDETSRNWPGHGYPAYTEHSWSIQLFNNEQSWKSEILKLINSKYKEEFKAVRCTSPKIEIKVDIK